MHFTKFLIYIVITCSLKIYFNLIRLFTSLSCTSSLPFRFSIKYSLYIFIAHASAHSVFVNFVIRKIFYLSPDSVIGISTHYGLVRGSNPGGGENFRTRPDRLWVPTSLLYNGYRVILGVKRPGHDINHPPASNAEVKEIVDLCLYSLSVPS